MPFSQNSLDELPNSRSNNDLLEYTCINPPHESIPFLCHLLKEARESILIGHYLSGILVLNCYIEALVKEIIFIHERKNFRGELGPAINHLKNKKYISEKDVRILIDFKNNIRNPYTHNDVTSLLKNRYIIMEKHTISTSNIESLDMAIFNSPEEYKYVNLSDMPNVSFVASYDMIIRQQSIDTYNHVLDIARDFSKKYLSKHNNIIETEVAFKNGYTEEEWSKLDVKEIDTITKTINQVIIMPREAMEIILK